MYTHDTLAFFPCETHNVCLVQNFSNVSSINLNCLLSAMFGNVFYFCKESVIIQKRRESQRGTNLLFAKMRACSVYNGLILCRRHCFTIVAHNWTFWQMYLAWSILPKLYMCICIVLWMYFLILTPGLSVILCHLVCYTVSLRTFQGSRLH